MKETTNKNPRRKAKGSGFTLIEIMIAMFIFAILSISAFDFYLIISRVYLSNVSTRRVQQNIRTAMETISRYVKQAREIETIESDRKLYLKAKDDKGNIYRVGFIKECEDPPFAVAGVSCDDSDGNYPGKIGIISMAIDSVNDSPFSDETVFNPLTSSDLNITDFVVEPSPGIPMVLNIRIKAEMLEVGKGWEKGIGGEGVIEMNTSVALRGQYY